MSALDKIECCFGERTVIDLYGRYFIGITEQYTFTETLKGSDIYEATIQTLLMTNLTSYSMVDQNNKNKIRSGLLFLAHLCTMIEFYDRIMFNKIEEENQNFITEYFREGFS